MLVSSTSMNAASETAPAIIQGFIGVSGAGGLTGADIFGAALILFGARSRSYSRLAGSCENLMIGRQPDGRFDRHARTQSAPGILSRIESNPDRQSLYYLDVVAGCIFRRQQTVELSGGSGHPFDIAAVIASGGVYVDGDRLPSAHPAQLRFAKIGSNPDIVQI